MLAAYSPDRCQARDHSDITKQAFIKGYCSVMVATFSVLTKFKHGLYAMHAAYTYNLQAVFQKV